MKAAIFLFCLSVTAGFSQVLPFKIPPPRMVYRATNFDITWNAPANSWPEKVWIYDTKYSSFSGQDVSNMLALGGFKKSEIHENKTCGTVIASTSGKQFSISLSEGNIYYAAEPQYGLDHLVKDIPGTNEIISLTTNFLPMIGIPISEIREYPDGRPIISYDPNQIGMIYYEKDGSAVTNLNRRLITFRRALDGIEYFGQGGDGSIDFGERGRILDMIIHWRGVERLKQVQTATKEQMLQYLKNGNCFFPRWFYFPDHFKFDIDWTQVRHLIINKVKPYYFGADAPSGEIAAQNYIIPFAVLTARVDLPTTNLDIEIHCPLVKY